MRVFRSKVDPGILLLAIIPVLVALLIVAIATRGDLKIVIPVLLVIAVLAIPMSGTIRKTDYTIDGDELRIRSGFLSWTIAIHSIDAVTPTRSMASGPAMSLDRLAIYFWRDGERKAILVSPADKAGFLAALRQVKPSIRG